ncbi:MAG: hypothetical protein U0835_06800 [Isosphaeraceae bacterium]
MAEPMRGRGFTLQELSVLVAATALGLGLTRSVMEGFPGTGFVRGFRPLIATQRWVALATCPLIPLTVAALVLTNLREPPPRRRLARKPGFVATAVATLAGLLYFIFALLQVALMPPGLYGGRYLAVIVQGAHVYTGAAVLGAWTSMLLRGSWRPEASALDRLGRVVGASWVALIVLNWTLTLLRFW